MKKFFTNPYIGEAFFFTYISALIIFVHMIVIEDYWLLLSILSVLFAFIFATHRPTLFSALWMAFLIGFLAGISPNKIGKIYIFLTGLLWFANCASIGIKIIEEHEKEDDFEE